MKRLLMLLIVACSVLAGCYASTSVITREMLIGHYVYKSEDPEGRASDHVWDKLTLGADGKYDLLEGGPTKPKSEKVGAWRIEPEGVNGPELILEHEASFPIRVKQAEVRLLIDNDVGIWYVKVE